MNEILKINNWTYFLILCLTTLLFAFLTKHFLLSDDLYYATFGEQLTVNQIHKLLSSNDQWNYLAYFLAPLIILIRSFYTSFCLFTGNLLQENHWKYKQLFNLSLKADAVFLLSQIINFYYYTSIYEPKTINEIGVNCLSLLKWVGNDTMPQWLVFAYNAINVFELLYLIMLVLFIRTISKLSYIKSTLFVLFTYEIGNYFYVVLITFLYLNYL